MRTRIKKKMLSVNAVAGTNTVLLGMDVPRSERKGLLGFAIHRVDHKTKIAKWLKGFRTFKETEPENMKPGQLVPTNEHPIQAFLWGDYTVYPDRIYTYTVYSLYGTPQNLTVGKEVSIRVLTESEEVGRHSIFFNRGVAGSQAYAREFGNLPPNKVPDRKAYTWLSRGLEEAILRFIGQAKNKSYSLRAAVYEFNHAPVLDAFAQAAKKDADVKIVYDRRTRGPFESTERAVEKAGIGNLMIPRTKNPSYIAHNKFIVLLKDGKPIQVWTGSTNLTEGGIFGQSNVGHQIRDEEIAAQYMAYWERLAADPDAKALRKANMEVTPDPVDDPAEDTLLPLFSPRSSLTALEWYAGLIDRAKHSSIFTAAFGVSDTFATVLEKESPFLRYIMLETPGGTYDRFKDVKGNRIALGSVLKQERVIGDSELHHWLSERLTGLNTHAKYLHTKYMVVDPLSDNPIIITGSANFSSPSTKDNDENMVVIQGDTRVADIFIGEFMRLFNHFYFRNIVDRMVTHQPEETYYLAPDESWTKSYYTSGSIHEQERKLFA